MSEKVIAKRGSDLLLDVGGDMGVVVLEGAERTKPAYIPSILARGYWEEVTGLEAAILQRTLGDRDENSSRRDSEV